MTWAASPTHLIPRPPSRGPCRLLQSTRLARHVALVVLARFGWGFRVQRLFSFEIQERKSWAWAGLQLSGCHRGVGIARAAEFRLAHPDERREHGVHLDRRSLDAGPRPSLLVATVPMSLICTGAGEDHGIDHNKNWLRFPYVSTIFAIPLPAPTRIFLSRT
jgi:hypothetical protein